MAEPRRQPNIVFVMADQLGAASIGAYGSGVESTPTLDRLAAFGTRFTRCYSSVAVCAPNRASILTGRSPVAHGLTANNLELDMRTPTYAQVLGAAGYRLGGFGKFHQTSLALPLPPTMEFLGFDESVPTEDSRLGPWLDWVARVHPDWFETALATCWPMPYLSESDRIAWQRAYERHLEPLKKASAWPLMYPSPLPEEVQQTTWITDLGLDFMSRHLADHPDKPFFCHLSYVDPHDPYEPPAPYDTMFAPAEMPTPLPADWTDRSPPALVKKRAFAGFDKIAGDADAVATLRSYYHGSLRFIDDQISRLVDFLRASGEWENTIVVFTSDHGELLGDHQLITKGVAHYDSGVRCPLIVAGGAIESGRVGGIRSGENRGVDGGAKGEGTNSRLVCSLDFFPTFCDWAGITHRPPLEGRSFADLRLATEHGVHEEGSGLREGGYAVPTGKREAVEDLESKWSGRSVVPRDDGWPEITVESDHCPDVHQSVRSIISDDGWRLTLFDGDDYAEMFDLVADPNEAHNLFFDQRHVDRKLELLQRHARAYQRQAQTPQYANLPRAGGRRHYLVNGMELGEEVPSYDD